ncbi:UxaA family hydrolase [Bordetella genomosp. 13]|uniref:UxaA family hydrolase n=1 Tax=Bordetella genomosp. 13 TaxID=463040 RepID=UPI00119E2177|nr:UxaA family hydrolase [Bordetella genomosp. 13]
MSRAIQLDPSDNVATIVGDPVNADDAIRIQGDGGVTLQARASIAFGHKVALEAIAAGQAVVKYGEVIGRASRDIAQGDHVHSHNLQTERARGDRGEVEA